MNRIIFCMSRLMISIKTFAKIIFYFCTQQITHSYISFDLQLTFCYNRSYWRSIKLLFVVIDSVLEPTRHGTAQHGTTRFTNPPRSLFALGFSRTILFECRISSRLKNSKTFLQIDFTALKKKRLKLFKESSKLCTLFTRWLLFSIKTLQLFDPESAFVHVFLPFH